MAMASWQFRIVEKSTHKVVGHGATADEAWEDAFEWMLANEVRVDSSRFEQQCTTPSGYGQSWVRG